MHKQCVNKAADKPQQHSQVVLSHYIWKDWMYCTTYDVQSTQCYEAEAVEWLSVSLLLHLLNQDICLFIHDL